MNHTYGNLNHQMQRKQISFHNKHGVSKQDDVLIAT